METGKYIFDFIVDKEGPHKISKESYLEKDRLALMVIDMQNYITENLYTGKVLSQNKSCN
ncbi:MAG: hypothetical protein KKE35_03355 [Actinobacteria bacterium]|nr:hypothetical protein [Actinomycetota bacterium]